MTNSEFGVLTFQYLNRQNGHKRMQEAIMASLKKGFALEDAATFYVVEYYHKPCLSGPDRQFRDEALRLAAENEKKGKQ